MGENPHYYYKKLLVSGCTLRRLAVEFTSAFYFRICHLVTHTLFFNNLPNYSLLAVDITVPSARIHSIVACVASSSRAQSGVCFPRAVKSNSRGSARVQFAPYADTVNALRTKLPIAESGVFPEKPLRVICFEFFTSPQMLFPLQPTPSSLHVTPSILFYGY